MKAWSERLFSHIVVVLTALSVLACTAPAARAQGKSTLTEPLLKRFLAMKEKALGPDHPDVALGLENLAGLYRSTKREAEAEKLEQRAARIRAIER